LAVVASSNDKDARSSNVPNAKAEKDVDTKKSKTPWQVWLEKFGFELENEDELKNVPKISYFEIFRIFFWFGCRAFGGTFLSKIFVETNLK
jgi:hypothetical protein